MAETQKPTEAAAAENTAADNIPSPPAPEQQPAVDVQTQIQQAVEAQNAAFAAKLKELTGHESLEALNQAQLAQQGKTEELLQAKADEAARYRARFEQAQVRSALLGAASDAVDPETVASLLSGQAQVAEDGSVTVGGKPAAESVAALLKQKPFLAKPAGQPGSAAPQSPGGGKNPWSTEHFNLTEQATIAREDPAEAERLRNAAA